MGRDGHIKPIGWKPDGSHINKGSLLLVVAVLVGLYCIFADAPFSWLFSTTPTVVEHTMNHVAK